MPMLLAALTASALALQYPVNLAAAASLLEISLPSSRSAVRIAYRKKALTAHPDVCGGSADATHRFMRITAAYESLLVWSTVVSPMHVSTSGAATAESAGGNEATGGGSGSSSSSSSTRRRRRSSSGGHSTGGGHDAYWRAAESEHHRRSAQSRGDSEALEQRVAAWRSYWHAHLQAGQLAAEAERKRVQEGVLESEMQRLREVLATLIEQGGAGVDACRARYARASACHADVACAVITLKARAQVLQAESLEWQEVAQRCVS